jgi:hypothetical protein
LRRVQHTFIIFPWHFDAILSSIIASFILGKAGVGLFNHKCGEFFIAKIGCPMTGAKISPTFLIF